MSNGNLFRAADILLPAHTDMQRWSVVACDQYTSEPEYWRELSEYVGDAPSTLRLTLPEIYLGTGEEARRSDAAVDACTQYLQSGFFEQFPDAYVYTLRRLRDGGVRRGLVGMADLLQYDYSEGSVSPIRATEATVLERIPPRMAIRRRMPVEFPHVMLLADDPEDALFRFLDGRKDGYRKLYDFPLNMDSGHVTGYLVAQADHGFIDQYFQALAAADSAKTRYGIDAPPLALAVGDGNHSLATAKAVFLERTKDMTPEQRLSDPSRFALCEVVNLHDRTLQFEPIHRVLFGVDKQKLLNRLHSVHSVADGEAPGAQSFTLVDAEGERTLSILDPRHNLTVGTLQLFLDEYLKENEGEIDYIHGDGTVRALAGKGALGFLLPAMRKQQLFPTVIQDGVLPRKTFSMGHACDKRFYLEGRRIRRKEER